MINEKIGNFQEIIQGLRNSISAKLSEPKNAGLKGQVLASDGAGGTQWQDQATPEMMRERVDKLCSDGLSEIKQQNDTNMANINKQIEALNTKNAATVSKVEETNKKSEAALKDLDTKAAQMQENIDEYAVMKKVLIPLTEWKNSNAPYTAEITYPGIKVTDDFKIVDIVYTGDIEVDQVSKDNLTAIFCGRTGENKLIFTADKRKPTAPVAFYIEKVKSGITV